MRNKEYKGNYFIFDRDKSRYINPERVSATLIAKNSSITNLYNLFEEESNNLFKITEYIKIKSGIKNGPDMIIIDLVNLTSKNLYKIRLTGTPLFEIGYTMTNSNFKKLSRKGTSTLKLNVNHKKALGSLIGSLQNKK